MITLGSYKNLSRIGAFAGVLLTQFACAGDGTVGGDVLVVNRTSQALLSVDLESVNGTYGAGCTDRSGSWSLRILPAVTLTNPLLSVVLNDEACVLTLTSLRMPGNVVIPATDPMILTAAYQATASAFAVPLAPDFYANARMSAVDFAANFTITIVYSDDPTLANASNMAGFAVVASSATAAAVPAPDYAINMAGLFLLTDVDDIVESASGSAALTENVVAGQTYVVVDASGLVTYDAIDAAYIAGVDAPLTATIAAAAFGLVGDDLSTPQVRTLIIANTDQGVASYQAFEITFNAAM